MLQVCRNARYITRTSSGVRTTGIQGFRHWLCAQSIKIPIIKLTIQIISTIFFFITFNPGTTCNSFIGSYVRNSTAETRCQSQGKEHKTNLTFDTFVSGLALRTSLISFAPFVLITSPANWESTLVASNKGLPIHSDLYLIPTNLTYLSTQLSNRLNLSRIKQRKQEFSVIST